MLSCSPGGEFWPKHAVCYFPARRRRPSERSAKSLTAGNSGGCRDPGPAALHHSAMTPEKSIRKLIPYRIDERRRLGRRAQSALVSARHEHFLKTPPHKRKKAGTFSSGLYSCSGIVRARSSALDFLIEPVAFLPDRCKRPKRHGRSAGSHGPIVRSTAHWLCGQKLFAREAIVGWIDREEA